MMKQDKDFMLFYNFIKSKELDRVFNQYDNEIIATQYAIPINLSSPYVGEGDAALDWSCGNGHFSLYLAYKKSHVTGSSFYNVIPEYLMNESLFSLKIVDEKESIALPFRDESFDVVFSIGVLEHVHETGGNQQLSLKEIRRILRKGCHFLCFHLPNQYSFVENICRLIPNGLRQKLPFGNPHSKRFNKETIVSMLEHAGFSVEAYGLYNFLPRNFSGALPTSLKHNRYVISIFNGVDQLLSSVLPQLCTHSYFIACKRT